ncbi:MAG TPA: glycosyltransferase [Burkholderiaceae bacterium]|jgi:hypothetical protein
MSVKQFGIYLAYAPTVDLRHEGLGRYLAAFLRGAAERDDVRFVVLCPSWSHEDLRAFFISEALPEQRFDLRYPKDKPLIMRAYEAYRRHKLRPVKPALHQRVIAWARAAKTRFMEHVEERLVRARSIAGLLTLLPAGLALVFLLVVLSPLLLLTTLSLYLLHLVRRLFRRAIEPLAAVLRRARIALSNPKEDGFVLRLYGRMAQAESARMLTLIDGLPQVAAWYCPTAFWPAFNDIRGPKLMCVPDMVLAEFPVDYAGVGGDRFFATFEAVESAIRSGRHFVTYSNTVKWQTLVERYAVEAHDVAVIRHAQNDLSQWVTVRGFDNAEDTARCHCEQLLLEALRKSSNPRYANDFANGSVKFIFYASQFRPNKNLLSLLKAYEYLLRKRLIAHKLILTGNPEAWPPVRRFITEHFLENDVLCLHKLTVQELAACYKLAALAVNPSLSEGGCPFTFGEALSVGTPVVMARIPVTEEVLTDPILQQKTFFDPYNWKDMAQRIEWALTHRGELLGVQQVTFSALRQRSWRDVVDEHIDVLERISDPAASSNNAMTADAKSPTRNQR